LSFVVLIAHLLSFELENNPDIYEKIILKKFKGYFFDIGTTFFQSSI